MPKITIEHNENTGEMKISIDGIVGPSCDSILEMAESLMGAATQVEHKPEYHVALQMQGQMEIRGGA